MFVLGAFEELILLAVGHIGTDEVLASQVIAALESATGIEASDGSIHATIDKMAAKGWLQIRREPRQGKPFKFVKITAAGWEVLDKAERLRRELEFHSWRFAATCSPQAREGLEPVK